MNITATAESSPPQAEQIPRKSRIALYGYAILVATLVAGWMLREEKLVNPEEGFGYWLGIVGGSMMLLLLLYPAGKKSSLLQRFGLVKHWFQFHMLLGLLGPSLVLFHSNFSVDAMNSKVAFYSMLGVAISGIIGRHFYTRIHSGLYGKQTSIRELRAEIADSMENSRGLAAILPGFVGELHSISDELLGDQYTRSMSIGRSLSWTCKYYIVRARLYLLIRRELRTGAMTSEALRGKARSLQKRANAYAAQQVGLMRQVAQISFYERLFSLWHLAHMPLFLLLVVSALVHVLAVHMY